MRWQGRRQSSNVSLAKGGGVVGLGAIVVAVIYSLMGGDPREVLDTAGGSGQQVPLDDASRTAEQEFAAVVLADTEDVWNRVFKESGGQYEEPELVLFSGAVQSACGGASSAVGPFYCPRDKQIYLDLSFFNELENRFGAAGDFARAYVIAHEVGHHVQNLLGIMAKAEGQSVELELQADCLAGMWAREAERTQHILEQGDFEEAMGAAAAVGDDRLQQQTQGQVVPDSFTHGSSEQRMRWFKAGFEGEGLGDCDTFASGVAH